MFMAAGGCFHRLAALDRSAKHGEPGEVWCATRYPKRVLIVYSERQALGWDRDERVISMSYEVPLGGDSRT